jgi:hypothetical protein
LQEAAEPPLQVPPSLRWGLFPPVRAMLDGRAQAAVRDLPPQQLAWRRVEDLRSRSTAAQLEPSRELAVVPRPEVALRSPATRAT